MPFIIPNTETAIILFGPIAVSFILLLLVTVISYYHANNLSVYVKRKKPSLWKEVYAPTEPRKVLDPFRILTFIKSASGNDDKSILDLKSNVGKWVKLQQLLIFLVLASLVYTVAALSYASTAFAV